MRHDTITRIFTFVHYGFSTNSVAYSFTLTKLILYFSCLGRFGQVRRKHVPSSKVCPLEVLQSSTCSSCSGQIKTPERLPKQKNEPRFKKKL